MKEFDVHSNDLVVIPFQPSKLLLDQLPEMARHFDIATSYDNVHATSLARYLATHRETSSNRVTVAVVAKTTRRLAWSGQR